MASDILYLDIGNTIFRTTKSTLVNVDGFFARMLAGNWAETGTKENPIFVDRDPSTFPSILSFLRSRKVILSAAEDNTYLQKLLVEADFYMLSDLSSAISEELQRREVVASQSAEDYVYVSIPSANLNAYFDRGWTYVDKYRDDESAACAATGTRQIATWVNYCCSACRESMSLERFQKHITLYERTMIVLKRHKSQGNAHSFLPENGGGFRDVDVIAFDQSFG